MATSRSGRPAAPTLGGTTTDAARGGFFAGGQTASAGTLQSDVVVNDSTITISINGESREFTLNQADPETLTFTVAGGGSGGSDQAFVGAAFDTANPRNIILTRESGQDPVTLTLPEDMMADLTALTARVAANETSITNLTGRVTTLEGVDPVLSVSINGGTAVTPNANGLVDIVSPTGTVVVGSTTQLSNSVQELRSITIGTGADAMVFRVGAGITPTGPTNPDARETFRPPSTNALVTPAPAEQEITITGGSTNPDGSGVTTTVTRDGMPVSTTTTETINPAGTEVDVTVPATDITDPGDYVVTTTIMVTPTDPDGSTDPITVTDTFSRRIPYFVSRSDFTDSDSITRATPEAGGSEWGGVITTPGGSGSTYIATAGLDDTATYTVTIAGGFRINNRFLRNITITPQGGNPIVYRIWQIASVAAGTTVTFTRN